MKKQNYEQQQRADKERLKRLQQLLVDKVFHIKVREVTRSYSDDGFIAKCFIVELDQYLDLNVTPLARLTK